MNDMTYPPSSDLVKSAHIDAAGYEEMYARSVSDPDGFWAEQAQRLDWIKAPSQVSDVDFTLGQVKINWFADGTLNVAANCIDRHLATRGDQTAIIFEPDNPDEAAKHITYRDLHRSVCKM
ncbi:acetyl-coenzyme A synthetase N-terminal domain-containing protein, partial [Marivita sp. S0852]|uniref:acetyl-coenzyme A synthetase N-terminal domain-containing protein n=1 Tax=Marivita sp. S0852 TaxID=3373893 RepID=UPI0039824A75